MGIKATFRRISIESAALAASFTLSTRRGRQPAVGSGLRLLAQLDRPKVPIPKNQITGN